MDPAADSGPAADQKTDVSPPSRVGSPPPAGASHRDFLITSTERDAAEARLRAAFADDLLTFDELGDRMRLLLAARTRGELHAALADLPATPRTTADAAARPRGQPVADPAAARREQVHAWRTDARRLLGGLLAAAALAVPVGWAVTANDVAGAAFGSTTETVSATQVEDADSSVGVLLVFGSAEIRVPEGVAVERDGLVVFGSTDCAPCGDAVAADARTVQIRTVGAFGSVDVVRVPPAGAD